MATLPAVASQIGHSLASAFIAPHNARVLPVNHAEVRSYVS